jgi:hypothetical protein
MVMQEDVNLSDLNSKLESTVLNQRLNPNRPSNQIIKSTVVNHGSSPALIAK